MDKQDRKDLCEIAIRAISTLRRSTVVSRHYDLWSLAIRRIDQTLVDIEADEEIAKSKAGIRV